MPHPNPSVLLDSIKAEASAKARFNMNKEGLYRGVLRASFAKCFEFAQYVHSIEMEKADEGALFFSGALRGLAEDFIALKFIRRLKRKERDSVIKIEMVLTTAQLIEKQAHFFKKHRPSQPVMTKFLNASELDKLKNELTTIGQTSKLWNTQKKLPPIEQMASAVNLKSFYEFIYRMTSRIVHFNVGVALRSGWGNSPKEVTFSSKNFCRYYLQLNQFYSLYILANFCQTFRKELGLSPDLVKNVFEIRSIIQDELRWPEAITFEEMNVKGPNDLVRATLLVYDRERKKKVKLQSKTRPADKAQTDSMPHIQYP